MKTIIYATLFLKLLEVGVSAQLLTQNKGKILISTRFSVGATNYVSTVYESDLKNTPPWKEAQECPPLCPRKAIEASERMAGKLFPEVPMAMAQVVLKPVGSENKWVYEVGFHTGEERGSQIILLVIMNGDVIVPVPVPRQTGKRDAP